MDKKSWEEIEEKKKYLNGYRKAKNRERRILEQIQQLRLDTMTPSVKQSDMPNRSGGDSDLSDYIERKEELLEELESDRLEAVRQYQEIYRSIKRMKDDDEREVLTQYYLLMEKWEDIPKKIGYSRSGMFNIFDRALKNFQIL